MEAKKKIKIRKNLAYFSRLAYFRETKSSVHCVKQNTSQVIVFSFTSFLYNNRQLG